MFRMRRTNSEEREVLIVHRNNEEYRNRGSYRPCNTGLLYFMKLSRSLENTSDIGDILNVCLTCKSIFHEAGGVVAVD
jgi:hypothetical protein